MKKVIALCLSLAFLLFTAACSDASHTAGPWIPAVPAPAERPALEWDRQPEVFGGEEPELELEPDWEWESDLPDHQGLRSSALPEIREIFDSFPLLASVIVKNGYIVDEFYKEGYDANSQFILNSASKSITSALIGIAIDRGDIESVDVLLSEYFPETLELSSDYWKDITLWHLLTHTSGIASTDSERWTAWRGSENWLEYIFHLPVVSQPGAEFHYSTGNTHLLSAVLQRATGMTAYEYGKRYLFEPVGMDSVSCDIDPQGISDGGNGFWMNLYDMARLGWLYRNQGIWEGEQIVSAQWVKESTAIQFHRSSGSADYGYQWWVRTFGQARYNAFFAQGHGGQYIFVVPELKLVVAFTSNYTGQTSIYWQLVNQIVEACDPPQA